MRIKILLLLFIISSAAFAQQLPQYSQYIFNGLAINPGYAGSKGFVNANATYRSQWTNIDGSPVTQSLMIDGPMTNSRMGWGAQVLNDQIGAQGRISLLGTYAYRVHFSENARLGFGLSGGAERFSVNMDKLVTANAYDPAVMALAESKWRPDARFGMFFNTERFYAGASVMNIFGNMVSKSSEMIGIHRHYFLNAGYLFDLGERVKLKPGFMIKEDFRSQTNIDLNSFVLLDERVWLGATYRTGTMMMSRALGNEVIKRNAVVFAAEYFISSNFRIGYSYDADIAGLKSFNTHEFSLGYNFMKKQESSMVSPRYF